MDGVRDLCRSCDSIALQETWLLPDEVPYLSSVDSEFGYTGTSAYTSSAGILRARPFGGVVLLWRSSVFLNESMLPCDNTCVCIIKIITSDRPVIESLSQFTDCLGTMSAIIDEYGV